MLLVLAFLGGATEIGAHLVRGEHSFVLGSYDVWYAMWPGSLVTFEIKMEQNFPAWVWDPVLRTVLMLPPWALFGFPGGALVWFFHPHHGKMIDPEEEESLFLYDELARQAIADGYADEDDDRLPSHAMPDDFDPGLDTIGRGDEDFDPADLLPGPDDGDEGKTH